MNTKNILFSLAFLFASCTQVVMAQENLSLQEAITTALKNNYDIKLVNNDVQITKNNLNIGNAGMLPTLGGTFTSGGSVQNTVQTPATGAERKANGVRSTNSSYGVALDWTIFDGFQMFANYDRLKELQKQGDVNAKATILTTVSNIVSAYYALVRQQQLVKATDSALDISRLRVVIADNKLKIGRGSKLDVLTAQVDYNADTTLYLQQKNIMQTAMVTLNQIMARDLSMTFAVNEKTNIEHGLNLADLEIQTQQLNPDLQNAFINKKIAELNVKQIKGQRYPVVGLNSGYEFSKSTSPTGFNQKFKANGLTYGVTATMNIFNGFLQRQNERNAKVLLSSSELSLDKTKQDIKALLVSTFQNYATNLDLLKVESGNVELAKQNLDITFEKYRLGSISPLELREAQRNSINAIIRFLDAQYQAKLTEISLKQISGTLNVQ
jgi:outer membrane protein